MDEIKGDTRLLPREATDSVDEHLRWAREHAAGDSVLHRILKEPEGALFGRYRIEGLLGSGGMGFVFLASDDLLARRVALKLLRESDPTAVERLVVEARSQARLRHENVCQVYEAGTEAGVPFVAMQYVDGDTLDSPSLKMTVEEKVRLAARIAEALHVAHGEGVVHRDVKPGNVLVERLPDGRLHPYLVDFGLAREVAGAQLTTSGFVVGTPKYMSPEQARGDRNVDRRSDVYGLGATLFELLTGRAPFEGSAGVDVMMQVVNSDAPGLRKLAPELPADLGTIVDKCLAKDPGGRYDSAKALAEDLERFLAGDPISARPLTTLQRVARLRRRHRAAFMVGGASLVALLLVGSLWAWSAWRASRRVTIARTSAQEAERIETSLRIAYLLPLHDTGPEKARTRERMERLKAMMRKLGREGKGPAAYALGRGHLALREYEKARALLEEAWAAGFHEPEVAHALGRTLGMLYQRARENARRVENREAREARLAAVQRELRDPALEWLRKGRVRAATPGDETEAFLASVEGDLARAETRAKKAFQADAGLFEAARLAGEMALADAVELQRRGETARAAARFAEADGLLSRAADVARSDPSTREAICRLRLEEAVVDYNSGRSPEASVEKGLAACGAARAADAESPWARETEAWHYFWLSEYRTSRGMDPRASLAEARKRADEAIPRLPPHPEIWNVRGQLGWVMAKWQVTHDEDPTGGIEASIADFRRALRIDPTFAPAYGNIGNVLLRRVDWEYSHGIDRRPTLQRAIDSYEEGIVRSPKVASLRLNLSNAYVRRAYAERLVGGDPRTLLDKAVRVAAEARKLSPAHYAGPFSEGNGHLGLAQAANRHGEDPLPHVEQAVRAFRKAIELKKDFANAFVNMSQALNERALWEVATGADASRTVEEALEAARRAMELKPDLLESYAAAGESRRALAYQLARDGKDAAPTWREALDVLEKAISIAPRDASTQQEKERTCLLAFQDGNRRGRPDPSFLVKARAAQQEAFRSAPDDPDGRLLGARLARVEAVWRLSRREKVENLVTEGLVLAEEALKRNPISDARLERAALLLVRSRSELAEAGTAAAAGHQQELELLRTELAKRPLLRLEYGVFVAWAGR